jgi:hypothetical protein
MTITGVRRPPDPPAHEAPHERNRVRRRLFLIPVGSGEEKLKSQAGNHWSCKFLLSYSVEIDSPDTRNPLRPSLLEDTDDGSGPSHEG